MLKKLKISNFTCFPEAHISFSPGLNVIIGENGTGKSHLLKLGYAVLRSVKQTKKDLTRPPSKEVFGRDMAGHLEALFMPKSLGRLATRAQGHVRCNICADLREDAQIEFSFSTSSMEKTIVETLELPKNIPPAPVFIPPKEVLSVYPGFAHAIRNRELQFDETYLDICEMLDGAALKGKSLDKMHTLTKKLESLVGGDIRFADGNFYLHSTSGRGNFEAHLMAEGFCKLGMLAYLIKNGSLSNSSSLFWDEPEANLNPGILCHLAEILFDLSSRIQIVIASHSLFLLRQLEILQTSRNKKDKSPEITYLGLHFIDKEKGVSIKQGNSMDDIGDIAALDAELAQSEQYLEME